MEIQVFRTPEEQQQGVHLETRKPGGRLPVDTVYFFPSTGDSAQVVSRDIPEDLRVYFLDRNFNVLSYIERFGPGTVMTPPRTAHVVETSVNMPEITDFGFLWAHLQ
jgi:hypothetical protein